MRSYKKLNNIYYIIFINKISKITSLLQRQTICEIKIKIHENIMTS